MTGVTRAERVSAARSLRDLGWTQAAIASRLEISRSYVSELLVDPSGEKVKARKDGYRGRCEVCGARTDGSNGRSGAPGLCNAHARDLQHEQRFWTRENVSRALAAIDAVALQVLGRHVQSNDWHATCDSEVLRLSEARVVESEYLWRVCWQRGIRKPAMLTIAREFGTWRNAARELGIPMGKPGSPSHRRGIAGVAEKAA